MRARHAGFVAVLSGARDVVAVARNRCSAQGQRGGPATRHGAVRTPQPGDAACPAVRDRPRDVVDAAAFDAAADQLPAGFAVRYEPAVSPLEIGGDFYDVLPVGDNRIGIIVGDCVGRGLSAAAVMGQLRARRARCCSPAPNRRSCSNSSTRWPSFIPDAFCATVFVAIARHSDAQTLHYSSAGHVPRGARPPESHRRELLTDGALGAAGGAQRRTPAAGRRAIDRRAPHCCCTPTGWSSGATNRSTTRIDRVAEVVARNHRSTSRSRGRRDPAQTGARGRIRRRCRDRGLSPCPPSALAHRRRRDPATVERHPAPAGRVA